ncbi:N-acetylmuramic acid 6-phosphate etherase [Rhodobacteraceae bacterium DSL-40]|uniref:N-acetylmuramic acid 6-phosphate etherase n=1 Tax=Amaricoccus sp. B4 TaxID=3368557 RepID=UPI000DAC3EA8
MTASRTEARHALAEGLQGQAPATVLARLLGQQRDAAAAVEAAIPALARAAEAAAAALAAGGRVAYAGAGSAGLMAMADALELPGTYGLAPESTPVLFAGGAEALLHMKGAVEDDTADVPAALDALGFGPRDVAICVSASGTTPYTLAVAREAAARGATVVGIANVAGSTLLEEAAIAVLLDSGPEIVAGSTRMGAGTAQKIALNMLSTLAALRLGHVHEGLMVNLVADNEKLRKRAARIVAELAGCDAAVAESALAQASGAVKPAILIAAGAPGLARAEALLARAAGHLGPALAALAAARDS